MEQSCAGLRWSVVAGRAGQLPFGCSLWSRMHTSWKLEVCRTSRGQRSGKRPGVYYDQWDSRIDRCRAPEVRGPQYQLRCWKTRRFRQTGSTHRGITSSASFDRDTVGVIYSPVPHMEEFAHFDSEISYGMHFVELGKRGSGEW